MRLSAVIQRYLFMALFCLAGLFPAARSEAETLRLVTEPWPPLIDEQDGQPIGPLWSITYAVLKRMGQDVELTFVPWKRALDLVARDHADAVVGAGETEARKRLFLYPEEPLAQSETTVFSSRAAPVIFQDFKSLNGMTIGLSAGYAYAEDIWAAPEFDREEVRDIRAGLQMLMMGRIDGFLANRDVGWYEANRLGIADKLADSPKPVSAGPVYLMFSPETPPEFLKAFDQQLRAFRRTAAYRDIMRAYSPPEAAPDTDAE